MTKPVATLSIDLDDLWAYLKTAGKPGWEEAPSYLPLVLPRIREILARRAIRLTVFVVGRDAAKAENREQLAGLAADGHEIANHSFDHESWLSRRPREVIAADIAAADEAIEAATGQRPVGFRGPSFGLSSSLLSVLAERGYRYDASTFPTFLGPLARLYYRLRSGSAPKADDNRKLLFGSLKDGLRPLKPYTWEIEGRSLVEMPVTTFPLARTPIHFTYLVYLAGFSPWLARTYLRTALLACRLAGVSPSLLLHPPEFLGADEAPALRFFPGMGVSLETKLALVEDALGVLVESFEIVPMREHAERVARTRLAARRPEFEADRELLEPVAS
jgi:hypothetical protein